MLTENHKRGDSIALTEGLLIAARRLSGDGLALSVIALQCHLSQRERLSHSVKLPLLVKGSPSGRAGAKRLRGQGC